MILASQLDAHGIAASMELRKDIYALIMQSRPKNIVETGTYNGLGSTSAVLHGLADANIQGFSFISIEANDGFYNEAKKNLENEKYIGSLLLLNAVSVPRYMLPTFIPDVPEEIITDHMNPSNYLKEIPAKCNDDGLMTAMALINYKPDLVILDSAGHLGTIEFEYLIDIANKPYHLILDDTLHRKHYKTLEKAKQIGFKIVKESKQKFGHAIIYVQ